MARTGMWTKTANQIAEKKHDFLKDLRIFGNDVIYVEQIDTGTWDPVTDRKIGSKEYREILYIKAILQLPIKSGAQDDLTESTNSTSSFAGGHKLNVVDITGSIVGKLRVEVPLTMTGVYVINGISYRLKAILDNQNIGQLALWNVVHFVKA